MFAPAHPLLMYFQNRAVNGARTLSQRHSVDQFACGSLDGGERFTGLLKGIAFSDETLVWVRQALRESHHDERQFHDDAIAKLQREHRRLQDRIDSMYEDKLDGRIGNDFFDAKAADLAGPRARGGDGYG